MSTQILLLILITAATIIVAVNAAGDASPPSPDVVPGTVGPSTSATAILNAEHEPAAGAPPAAAGLGDSKASWWAYAHIHMVNELTGGKVMLVHCKSKNDDLGIHSVPAGSEYEWRFRPSVLGNTLFWCHVATGNKQIVYDAFYQDPKLWQRLHMDHSYWVAKDSGIYLRQFWKKPSTDVFWKPWP